MKDTHSNRINHVLIIYGEPIDCKQMPKNVADNDTIQAKWFSIDEFNQFNPKRRVNQVFEWWDAIAKGQKIHPIEQIQVRIPYVHMHT